MSEKSFEESVKCLRYVWESFENIVRNNFNWKGILKVVRHLSGIFHQFSRNWEKNQREFSQKCYENNFNYYRNLKKGNKKLRGVIWKILSKLRANIAEILGRFWKFFLKLEKSWRNSEKIQNFYRLRSQTFLT